MPSPPACALKGPAEAHQAELGERMGIAGFTVSDLKTGRRAVTANDLPLLCEVFDLSPAELARRADPSDLSRLRR